MLSVIRLTHQMLTSAGGLVSQTSTWFNQDNWPQEPTDSLVPHTCEWLFKSPKWQSWIRQHSSKLLFVSGPAGCGKTCLAISALRELRMNSSNLVISYFFNSACGSTANNAQKLLASILVQIYRKVCNTPQEAPFKSFNQRYSHYSTVWDCKFCELLTFVENVLNSYPAYSLVIDSVDECQTHRQDLISLLSKLVKRNGVAIMATSRNTSSWPSCEYEALDLQSYPDLVRSDVTKFVEYQVDTRLPLNSPKYVASRLFVIKTVIDRCENNFLHAKLFIDLLQQQSTWGGMKKVLSDVGCSYATDLYKKLWETLTARLSCYPWKLDRCRCIFRLLIAAREPLSPEQIDYFLALDDTTEAGEPEDLSFDVIKEIGELCNPFICFSAQNYVTFFHTSAKDFIASQSGTAEDDANLYLARRCLSSLSRPMYRNPKKATELLRRHLMPSSNSGPDSNDLGISSIYNYAVLYFQDHITAITKPPKDLVLKLGRFLSGVEFVTWSESILDLKPGTGYAGQINVSSSLSKWAQTLDQNDREDINLDQYFEAAHILLALILQNDEDQILQFFPRIRLADYLNGAARGSSDLQRGYEQKQIVVEGLSAILPEDSAFLLKQKVALLQEYFWQKRFPEVLRELRVVYKMQKRVATEDDLYTTAWLIGVALVVLGSYEEAQIIISDTLEQIRKQRGEKYRFFNILLLLEGNRLERVNELHQAATVYRVALETVSEVAGPKNLFALILMTALGSVLRKQGKYKEAETRLFEGYAGRQPTLSIDFNVCLDAALQLATLYRDKGNGTECLELLGSVQNSIVFDEDFERRCQLIHIRNLVALDNGDYMTAKHELLEILQAASGTNRDKNNRELLWVRIDLADAMRQRSEPDEALMLFSDLVEEIHSSDVYGEPEPPSQLALAEQALRLVRKAEFAKSRRLLSENNLRWVREADFWFSYQGGPTLDTAVIAPVRM